jgi:hypothetical protein
MSVSESEYAGPRGQYRRITNVDSLCPCILRSSSAGYHSGRRIKTFRRNELSFVRVGCIVPQKIKASDIRVLCASVLVKCFVRVF